MATDLGSAFFSGAGFGGIVVAGAAGFEIVDLGFEMGAATVFGFSRTLIGKTDFESACVAGFNPA